MIHKLNNSLISHWELNFTIIKNANFQTYHDINSTVLISIYF
jgi:hypothetical protein